mgnify:CR=1 FL=1
MDTYGLDPIGAEQDEFTVPSDQNKTVSLFLYIRADNYGSASL